MLLAVVGLGVVVAGDVHRHRQRIHHHLHLLRHTGAALRAGGRHRHLVGAGGRGGAAQSQHTALGVRGHPCGLAGQGNRGVRVFDVHVFHACAVGNGLSLSSLVDGERGLRFHRDGARDRILAAAVGVGGRHRVAATRRGRARKGVGRRLAGREPVRQVLEGDRAAGGELHIRNGRVRAHALRGVARDSDGHVLHRLDGDLARQRLRVAFAKAAVSVRLVGRSLNLVSVGNRSRSRVFGRTGNGDGFGRLILRHHHTCGQSAFHGNGCVIVVEHKLDLLTVTNRQFGHIRPLLRFQHGVWADGHLKGTLWKFPTIIINTIRQGCCLSHHKSCPRGRSNAWIIRVCIQRRSYKMLSRFKSRVFLSRVAAEHRVVRHVLPPQLRGREERHRGIGRAAVRVLHVHGVGARDRLPGRVGRVVVAGLGIRGEAQACELARGVRAVYARHRVGVGLRAAGGRHL